MKKYKSYHISYTLNGNRCNKWFLAFDKQGAFDRCIFESESKSFKRDETEIGTPTDMKIVDSFVC